MARQVGRPAQRPRRNGLFWRRPATCHPALRSGSDAPGTNIQGTRPGAPARGQSRPRNESRLPARLPGAPCPPRSGGLGLVHPARGEAENSSSMRLTQGRRIRAGVPGERARRPSSWPAPPGPVGLQERFIPGRPGAPCESRKNPGSARLLPGATVGRPCSSPIHSGCTPAPRRSLPGCGTGRHATGEPHS